MMAWARAGEVKNGRKSSSPRRTLLSSSFAPAGKIIFPSGPAIGAPQDSINATKISPSMRSRRKAARWLGSLAARIRLRSRSFSGSNMAGLDGTSVRARPDASASRRLGQRVLGLGEGPVEPERERLDVGGLDGCAAPDAQARRRITISVDIVGDAFLFERGRQALDEGCLRLGRQRRDRGVDHFQAHRRV